MTLAYVDSSVILRLILGEPGAYRHLHQLEKIYSSILTRVEVMRTLDRLRLHHQWPDAEVALRVSLYGKMESHIHVVDISTGVMERSAGSFPTPIRTLDALHAATFLRLTEELKGRWEFITHDLQQAHAITALGHTARGA